jgi:hypothetical protein
VLQPHGDVEPVRDRPRGDAGALTVLGGR